MKDFQKKQRIKRFMYSFPSLLILLFVTFFLVKGAYRVIGKVWESGKLSKALEEKSIALVIREEELETDIARLQTEDGVRAEIKERFNVSQEGEYVAVIVEGKNATSTTDRSNLVWYKRIWFAIMGNK